MAKKITGVASIETNNLGEELMGGLNIIEPTLSSTALSIVETKPRVYSVVSVSFNITTLESGNVQVLYEGLDKYEAQHYFKLETVKAELF